MNFVAGLLLQYLPERHAFGGLVVLMQDRELRKYYSTDLSLLQVGGGGVERGLRRGDRCFRHHRPVPAASGGGGEVQADSRGCRGQDRVTKKGRR
jgi:hypothetical protein